MRWMRCIFLIRTCDELLSTSPRHAAPQLTPTGYCLSLARFARLRGDRRRRRRVPPPRVDHPLDDLVRVPPPALLLVLARAVRVVVRDAAAHFPARAGSFVERESNALSKARRWVGRSVGQSSKSLRNEVHRANAVVWGLVRRKRTNSSRTSGVNRGPPNPSTPTNDPTTSRSRYTNVVGRFLSGYPGTHSRPGIFTNLVRGCFAASSSIAVASASLWTQCPPGRYLRAKRRSGKRRSVARVKSVAGRF
eukprot:31184-Pelagococcus_subviridis.AAC.4